MEADGPTPILLSIFKKNLWLEAWLIHYKNIQLLTVKETV